MDTHKEKIEDQEYEIILLLCLFIWDYGYF